MVEMKPVLCTIILLLLFSSPVSGADSENTIYLKEYFNTILANHIKQDELRFQLMDKALVIQGIDLARRLDELNHLKAERTEDKASYLRKDTFDQFVSERRIWQDNVNKSITQMYTVISVFGFLLVVINVILRWFPRKNGGTRI